MHILYNIYLFTSARFVKVLFLELLQLVNLKYIILWTYIYIKFM